MRHTAAASVAATARVNQQNHAYWHGVACISNRNSTWILTFNNSKALAKR
jgi:hypothetical protein